MTVGFIGFIANICYCLFKQFGNMVEVFEVMAFGVQHLDERDVGSDFMAVMIFSKVLYVFMTH